MKRHTRQFTAALLLTATPFSTLSCKKEDTAKAPAGATPESAEAAAAPATPATMDASAWGFAAKLPKSTEGFLAFYNTGSLVEGFLNSNWFAKLKANKAFGPQVQQVLSQLEAIPQATEALALVKELAGKEAVFVLSEGVTSHIGKLWDGLGPLLAAGAKSGFMRSSAAKGIDAPRPEPGNPFLFVRNSTSVEEQQRMADQLSSAEFPPLMAAFKVGPDHAKIDALIKQALGSMPPKLKAATVPGNYKVDGCEFQSLTFHSAKIPVMPDAEAAEAMEFSAIFGSEEKRKEFLAKMKTKTVEASWGWVGDYLVLSLGKDHSHVNFASGSDSVLELKEVSAHAAAWQAKNPFAFGYLSQGTSRALNSGSIFSVLASLVESAGFASPIPVAPIAADLNKLAARSMELWPNDADALTTAAWWDGGVHAECFGGVKQRAFDSSKPLSFTALAGPATIFSSATRVNEAESDKTFAFFEECCATLWESYQTNIKPSLPKETAAQTGMAEALGIPMIKGLWKGVQDFRSALGSESGMVVNLDGAMPALPNIPAEMKDVKIPRILYASELRDAAKLTAAWKGFGDVIGSVIALSKAPVKPKPTEKKDGDLTTWGWDLPMDLGDTWPHAAVSGSRWFFSTSTSLTKSAAEIPAASSGPSAGAVAKVNFGALWNYAASLVPLSSPNEREITTGILDLLGSVRELSAISGESGGTAHNQIHLRIQDAK